LSVVWCMGSGWVCELGVAYGHGLLAGRASLELMVRRSAWPIEVGGPLVGVAIEVVGGSPKGSRSRGACGGGGWRAT
jgi:hypothetical protein